MDDKTKRRRRLLRLPTVENFARNNRPRTDETTLALTNLDKNPPPFSLAPVKKLCADIALGKVTESDVGARLAKIGHPAAHQAAAEIVPEFMKFVSETHLEGVEDLHGFKVSYPIGPNPDGGTLNIPVAPTFVCFIGEQLVPVFLVPWAELVFSDFQKVLMSSIISDALLTHQDFMGCDALVLAFPLIPETRQRYRISWGAQSYTQMDRERLNHQFLKYGRALASVLASLDAETEE